MHLGNDGLPAVGIEKEAFWSQRLVRRCHPEHFPEPTGKELDERITAARDAYRLQLLLDEEKRARAGGELEVP